MKRVAVGDLRVDPADGQVHLGQSPRSVIGLLTVNRYVSNFATMCLDEVLAAHEHSPRPAAWVVHTSFERGEHLDEYTHHWRRGIKLSPAFAFSASEAGQEVLIHP